MICDLWFTFLMKGVFIMSKLFWLSQEQLNLISPYFPASRGVPRVDDRRVISGIIYVIKNGLRWCDAPRDYESTQNIVQSFHSLELHACI